MDVIMKRMCKLLLLISYFQRVQSDPCTSNMDVPMQHLRSTSNILNASDSSTAICDNFITEQWYRSSAGYDLVRHCPVFLQCHTFYQLWMNDELPTVSEGEVIRTVCMNGLMGCCETSLYIKVKNCGSYYVYRLRRPSGCPIAYCFESFLESTTVPDMSLTTSYTEPSNIVTQSTSSGLPTNSTRDNLWPLYLLLLLLLPTGFPIAVFAVQRRIKGWRTKNLGNFSSKMEVDVEANENLNLSQIGRGESTVTKGDETDTVITEREITDTALKKGEVTDKTSREKAKQGNINPGGNSKAARIRNNRPQRKIH